MRKKSFILSTFIILYILIKGLFCIKEMITPLMVKNIDGWLIPPYKTEYGGIVILTNPSPERWLGCKINCINAINDKYNKYIYKKITIKDLFSIKDLERVYILLLDVRLSCCKEKNHWVILKAVSEDKNVIVADPLYGDVFLKLDILKRIWKGKLIVSYKK